MGIPSGKQILAEAVRFVELLIQEQQKEFGATDQVVGDAKLVLAQLKLFQKDPQAANMILLQISSNPGFAQRGAAGRIFLDILLAHCEYQADQNLAPQKQRVLETRIHSLNTEEPVKQQLLKALSRIADVR